MYRTYLPTPPHAIGPGHIGQNGPGGQFRGGQIGENGPRKPITQPKIGPRAALGGTWKIFFLGHEHRDAFRGSIWQKQARVQILVGQIPRGGPIAWGGPITWGG